MLPKQHHESGTQGPIVIQPSLLPGARNVIKLHSPRPAKIVDLSFPSGLKVIDRADSLTELQCQFGRLLPLRQQVD
jgi:hypothetical protein